MSLTSSEAVARGARVRQSGTATTYAAGLLGGPRRPARILGAFRTACYLELPDRAVLALLTEDAVQLPIGVTVTGVGDLSGLTGLTGTAEVGDGAVHLAGLMVRFDAVRSAALRYAGRPVLPVRAGDLFDDPVAAVAVRLGAGPGLTPAGDDELCGALAANVLFGLDDSRLAAAVTARLADGPRATTSLSRALLERAVAGDGLPQLQRLAQALCHAPDEVPAAWAALRRIGHTSGTALGIGLLAGARQASSPKAA